MKIIRLFHFQKSILSAFLVVVMTFMFTSIDAQTVFLISSVVPSARGTVNVTKDKYNNYIINVKIENLAEAGRLQPAKNTYVVWMLTDDNKTKNIGQVRTTESFLFKKLNAAFETKSVFKPVKIFLSAEYDPNILEPGSVIVLTTDTFDLPKK
jgi:hypothetical protein